jgi:peptidoglycan/xylan/chitin deacetylase (PgdA/CDA1 family)|tara:strand:+ start:18848 stop:19423 length:576 start_codon:yes stop_codon:yes gene_type:complete
VYLTFDDGPDAVWTPRILDLLSDAEVPATFFVIGRLAREHPSLLRQISERGHDIGNHGWSHRHPWTMLPSTARREVSDGAAAISDITGLKAKLYRPPHGRQRRCMTDEARMNEQKLVLWDRSAIDWGPKGSASAIANRLSLVRGHEIVLMHDGSGRINRPDELVRELPAFLNRLSEHGLRPSLLREVNRWN